MTPAGLDGVESDFDDDAGFDFNSVAFAGLCQGKKFRGQLRDLGIGESGVGLADR